MNIKSHSLLPGLSMNVYAEPRRDAWADLVMRPTFDPAAVNSTVEQIVERVRAEGDDALRAFTKEFDGVELQKLTVPVDPSPVISQELRSAIDAAMENIEVFHASQAIGTERIETMSGVFCWRKAVPIDPVGLYIPGGTAPLFSSLMMLGVPARLAGCQNIVVCTPPDKSGRVHPAIHYIAGKLNIEALYAVGGAQAIGAMTYGTQSVPKVNKIFGPGNQYVTAAKMYAQFNGLAIDMPAGPSEVLVITDPTGVPEFIAADLLSQAEHGKDSQVVLIMTGFEDANAESVFLELIQNQLALQLEKLPRRAIAADALTNSMVVLLRETVDAIAFSNLYAPEHLILAMQNADEVSEMITNAGSVFIGNNSCESAGDYASGTNHTLPTNGYARSYSGVSLDSFTKKITFQEVTSQGILNVGPFVETLASAEGLDGHKNAVSVRLNALKNV